MTPDIVREVGTWSDDKRREVLRILLLEHPHAVEDNGRVTLDLPREFSHRAEVSVGFLANWLAPEVES